MLKITFLSRYRFTVPLINLVETFSIYKNGYGKQEPEGRSKEGESPSEVLR